MFSVILRAIMLIGAGGLTLLIFDLAASPFVDTMADHGPAASQNAYWSEQAVTWFPAIVMAAVVIMLIAGATARRGRI